MSMTDVRRDQHPKSESFIATNDEFIWPNSVLLASINSSHSCVYTTDPVNPQNVNEVLVCKVCSDKGSGRHYGQITCEGCKSFFKRSIRRKFDYVCRNNKECKVNMEQRNQCQACRFVKCLRVGMRKDAVQSSRSSRYQPDSTQSRVNSPQDNSMDDNEFNSVINPNSNLSIKDILNSVLQAEKAAPIIDVDNFYDQSVHILYSIVGWIKKLLYTDKISIADNLLLLQNSWCKLFILNYSMCGLISKVSCNANSSTQSFLCIQSQLLALNRIPMDAIEYGCLKAIVYFNPDTPLLFNSKMVDTAQETFQLAIENHIRSSSVNKARFGRILLRIPYLERITIKQILEVFFNGADESFAKSINELFHKLLSDYKSDGIMNDEINGC